ncbi:hypothetical protein D5086_032402 [Populus alba]|uniref:Uncharacterized protein n=1 Tax=Populus alba TaxID=43335 RepID=A0ACC4AL99_POPAL
METICNGSNNIGFMLLPVVVFASLIVYFGSPMNQNTNTVGYFSSFSTSNTVYTKANELVFESSQPSPSQPHQLPTQIKRGREKIEDGLARARAAILDAARLKNYTSYKEGTYVPKGVVYRNPYAFHQSHTEMEKRFKIWVYKEGEPPLVHGGPLNNIYGVEGQFLDEMELGKSPFAASHPDEAHMFLLPISVAYIITYVYKPLVTYSRDELQRLVQDYVGVVADKYPYWNRSKGADHFLVSCHDWAPDISGANPDLYKNFLGPPLKGLPPSKRSIFAFFAGGAHGYIRKVLLENWKDKDDEIQVHEYLDKKGADYFELMGQSKFCLCPSGYEVASPRVVTAIQLGCVPVTISDNYTLPFSDVLDWSKFSVHIPSEKIPEIKTILKKISPQRYLMMQKRVIQVQRHFELNRPARPYDLLHMLLHSVWVRRLNVKVPYR